MKVAFGILIVAFVALTFCEECEDKSHACADEDCRKSIFKKVCCKTCSGPNPPTGKPPIFTVPPKTCGKKMVAASRIAGGSTAKAGSWPWHALLFYKGYRSCGATIISSQHVLTGAHCVPVLAQPEHFIVRVGEHDVSISNEGFEVDHAVSNIFVKPGYSGITRDKDMAILKLKTPIQFNSHVQAACLPLNDVQTGAECFLTGWGEESYNGNLHTVLQQAKLPLVTNQVCRQFNGRIMTDNMLCGGNPRSGATGPCHGDTGGGLTCRNTDNTWTLHGILSYGHDTCDPSKLYSVFTRVRNFRAWIEETMRK